MNYNTCRAVAYPGLPVIFAEGYQIVRGRRISRHDSVGLCVTDSKEHVRTETVVEPSNEGVSFTVNVQKLSGSRRQGMLKIVKLMLEKSDYDGGLDISSTNYGILTGSSDSAAAALVTAMNSFLDLKLSLDELLQIGLYGSETVFRSLYGGLTEYRVGGDKHEADVLVNELDISIFTVPFEGRRFSADAIHKAVVSHPDYANRADSIREKITEVKGFLKKKSIVGILKLMEDDAREVHNLFMWTGHNVINPEMAELCDFVEDIRDGGLKCFWSVAGGSVVYVFSPGKEEAEIRDILQKKWDFKNYALAGAARSI